VSTYGVNLDKRISDKILYVVTNRDITATVCQPNFISLTECNKSGTIRKLPILISYYDLAQNYKKDKQQNTIKVNTLKAIPKY
jgi:hypothetical protein